MSTPTKTEATAAPAVQRRARRRPPPSPRSRARARPYLLLVPAAAFVAVVLLYPLGFNLVASFFTWRFTDIGNARFVGFDNYVFQLVANPDFWPAVRFTILFTVVTIVISLVLGVGMGMLLSAVRRGRSALMAIVLLPFVVAPLAVGLLWRMLVLPDISPINWALRALGLPAVNWLTDPVGAFWAVAIAEVWHSTPFVALMVLAAVATIPTDIYQAASLDGAGGLRRFWSITLPLLRPALTIVLVFQTVLKLRLYDLPYIMTNGGPGTATVPLGILLQREYFLNQQAGGAATIGTLLFLIGGLVSLLIVMTVYRKVEY